MSTRDSSEGEFRSLASLFETIATDRVVSPVGPSDATCRTSQAPDSPAVSVAGAAAPKPAPASIAQVAPAPDVDHAVVALPGSSGGGDPPASAPIAPSKFDLNEKKGGGPGGQKDPFFFLFLNVYRASLLFFSTAIVVSYTVTPSLCTSSCSSVRLGEPTGLREGRTWPNPWRGPVEYE